MAQERDNERRRSIRRLNTIGIAAILISVGGIGGWAASSRLAGAVISSGTLVVESNVKRVQHNAGGVVGEILVREGQAERDGRAVSLTLQKHNDRYLVEEITW